MPIYRDDIKDRMKEALSCGTDAELARRLGRHPGPISRWRVRGRIPKHAIDLAAALSGRSVDWLLTGRGESVVSEPPAFYGLANRIGLGDESALLDQVAPWLRGLVQILLSGDREKVESIQGNIQAFLEALRLPRIQAADVRASPRRRVKKQIS